jgi:hypothetical protein
MAIGDLCHVSLQMQMYHAEIGANIVKVTTYYEWFMCITCYTIQTQLTLNKL